MFRLLESDPRPEYYKKLNKKYDLLAFFILQIHNICLESPENKSQISLVEKYASFADSEGFVSVGSFAIKELNRPAKNVAGFIDGNMGDSLESNLGNGLRYKGDSGNYSDVKIHIDDLDEFIRRIKEYYGCRVTGML